MAGAVGGLVPVANDPLRSLPLRQIELPGDTKSIGEPSKSRAEAIVSQWHLHVTALGKPLERSVQVGSPVEIDEQRHRGCKIKPVGYWTVDNNQWVPVKVDPGNFYEPRSVIARPIFIHGHDSEAWKDRREQINRCLRSAALKHEVSAYRHQWKILSKDLVRGNDRSWPFASFRGDAEIQSLSERSGHSASRAYRTGFMSTRPSLPARRIARPSNLRIERLSLWLELQPARIVERSTIPRLTSR